MHSVWLDETPLVLFNLDGQVYALRDQCTHEDYELSAGHFDPGDAAVECTLHGARFDVRDGRALCAPAYTAAQRFDARIEDGGVYVRHP
jgi:3-phenylpropionate/trans-cinnamate dioxygenase ferredoxin subunit